MKTKTIYIDDLHFEHKLWKRQLEFERDELKVFNNRLEDIVQRWTDKEILAQVEHFQNSFIRHNEVIDTLLHEIKVHAQELEKDAKEKPNNIHRVHYDDHEEFRDQVETQLKIFGDLKTEFLRFVRGAM